MPIADMLAHLPPLPLILDYGDGDRDVTLEDEEGILLALRHRHRVRHIRFSMPASGLRRLVAVLDGEFIMLEKLYIKPLADGDNGLSLHDTLKVPLRSEEHYLLPWHVSSPAAHPSHSIRRKNQRIYIVFWPPSYGGMLPSAMFISLSVTTVHGQKIAEDIYLHP